MKRFGSLGLLTSVALAALTVSGFSFAADAPQAAPHWGEGGVPQFELDRNWPKVPSQFKVGFGTAVSGDTKGNVWILSRPRRLSKEDQAHAAPPVMVYDQAGNYIKGWGGKSGPGYQWPSNEHGMYVDEKGFVWIEGNQDSQKPGDLPNDNQIIKFDGDGKFVMAIAKSGLTGSNKTEVLKGATDMFVDYKNNRVYVSDGYGNSRIMVYNATTGAFEKMWGAYGHKPLDMADRPARSALKADPWMGVSEVLQQFGSPMHNVKVSNDGLLYAADRGNKRVQVFTPDGKFLHEQFVGIDLPDLQVRAIVFSPDPGQNFLYVGGTPEAWILNRRTLEILGTIQTIPTGAAPGQSGGTNIGHFLGVDTNGNFYTAAELSPALGNTRGAFKYTLKGYSPKVACCTAPRNISATAASTGSAEGVVQGVK